MPGFQIPVYRWSFFFFFFFATRWIGFEINSYGNQCDLNLKHTFFSFFFFLLVSLFSLYITSPAGDRLFFHFLVHLLSAHYSVACSKFPCSPIDLNMQSQQGKLYIHFFFFVQNVGYHVQNYTLYEKNDKRLLFSHLFANIFLLLLYISFWETKCAVKLYFTSLALFSDYRKSIFQIYITTCSNNNAII